MRLPETSVSLPDITLSDERGQGERADPPLGALSTHAVTDRGDAQIR